MSATRAFSYAAAAAIAAASWGPVASSQSYPTKPIRVIVPFGAYSDLLLVVHPSLPIVKLAGARTDR
jgi:hypothetical protein